MELEKLEKAGGKDLEEANRLFASVWKRVMRGMQVGPIVLTEQAPGEEEKTTPEAPEPEAARALCSAALPEAKGKEGEEEAADDFPPRQAVPFLGSGSAEFEALLLACIRREMQSRKLYQALSQRAGGAAAKHFSAMAAENLRAAKRLGAACFLITGRQPAPVSGPRPALGSYLHTLRERFLEEQQSSALYLAAAAESRDPWLARLFTELAEEKLGNAQRIYFLVETA